MKSPEIVSSPYVRIAFGVTTALGSLGLGACAQEQPEQLVAVTTTIEVPGTLETTTTTEAVSPTGPASISLSEELGQLEQLEQPATERLQQGQTLNFYDGILVASAPGRTTQKIERPFLFSPDGLEDQVDAQDIASGNFLFGYYDRTSNPGVVVLKYDPTFMTLTDTEHTVVGKGPAIERILPVVFSDETRTTGFNIDTPQDPATGLPYVRPDDNRIAPIAQLYTVRK